MEEALLWAHSLVTAFDVLMAVFGIALICVLAPLMVARWRGGAAVVGLKIPGNIRHFFVDLGVSPVRDLLPEFARKYGYTVSYAEELRGLTVLHEPAKGLFSPGMFYSVFLNQPEANKTRVSVGAHSPLAGIAIPGEFPRPNNRPQDIFIHRLAAELIQAAHPGAPKVAAPERSAAPAPEEVQPKLMEKSAAPVVLGFQLVAVLYVALILIVSVESLLPTIHETLEVRDKRSWATVSHDTGRVNHYEVMTTSRRWPTGVGEDVYERVRPGDRLDITAEPWSRSWKRVTVQRDGKVIFVSEQPLWRISLASLLHAVAALLCGWFLYAMWQERNAARRLRAAPN